MFRGILSTIYLDLKPKYQLIVAYNTLKKFHKKNKFVKILNIDSLIKYK